VIFTIAFLGLFISHRVVMGVH